MDRIQFEEILSSLDEMSPWELRELARMIIDRFPEAEPEEDRRSRERFEAWKTPWYTLTIVGAKPVESEETVPRLKKLGEILHCYSLLEVSRIMHSFPYEVVSLFGEYPLDCREKYRPLKESLEAIGFIVEEDYHFGHYA